MLIWCSMWMQFGFIFLHISLNFLFPRWSHSRNENQIFTGPIDYRTGSYWHFIDSFLWYISFFFVNFIIDRLHSFSSTIAKRKGEITTSCYEAGNDNFQTNFELNNYCISYLSTRNSITETHFVGKQHRSSYSSLD